MLNDLLEFYNNIRQELLNVYMMDMQLFPLEITNKILLKSLSSSDIKNFIGEKIIQFVKKHPDKKWDHWRLLRNPNVTIDVIDKYSADLPWNLAYMVDSPNLTMEFVNKYAEKLEQWCWMDISCNPNISVDDIENSLQHPVSGVKHLWEWKYISRNPNLTTAFIEKYANKIDIAGLSSCAHVPLDVIESRLDIDWNWKKVLERPDVTLEFIERHCDDTFEHGRAVSRNPNITLEFIDKHPNYRWDWPNISANAGITMDIVEKNIDRPWNWGLLSNNPNVTLEFVNRHPELPWDWCWIGTNITVEELEKALVSSDKGKLNMLHISMNSKLTMDFVEKYLESLPVTYIPNSIGEEDHRRLLKEIDAFFI